MSYHAAAVAKLRTIARTVMRSLPREVRRVLHGVRVQVGDLGYTSGGRKLLGLAKKDGCLVVLDRAYVVEGDLFDQAEEYEIENLLAHELGHIYRTRTGQHSENEAKEDLRQGRRLNRGDSVKGRGEDANRNRP